MRLAAVLCALALTAEIAAAQLAGPQMPDPRQMSGVPLPARELPAGTMTVRVIRGSLSNPIIGLSVEITGDTKASSTTNESGRAEFTGLSIGAKVKAVTVVNGERLESQQIEIPAGSGVRVMLVATDPEAMKRAEEDRRLAAAPAQRGTVVLGDQSRFVFELGDEGLNVFNIVQILNTARVPVEPPFPVRFELPAGAQNASLLEGSSPLAAIGGGRVDVTGPFPPGVTLVQFAYTMPFAGEAMSVRQVLPAQLTQLTIVAQKIGDMRLESTQVARQREMTSEGQIYILGQGPAVPAGGAVEFRFSGLPHTSSWPRNIALGLVLLILTGGAVVSMRGPASTRAAVDRERLTAQRDRLFEELTALEKDHRTGRVDSSFYASQREQLIASLEDVYAALDLPLTASAKATALRPAEGRAEQSRGTVSPSEFQRRRNAEAASSKITTAL